MTFQNRQHHLLLMTMAIAVVSFLLGGCSGKGGPTSLGKHDSAFDRYEDSITTLLDDTPEKILLLIDSLEDHHAVEEYKALFYRAMAYYKLGQELTAELYYKKVLSNEDLYNDRPVNYYYACDQLSTILTCKGEQLGSIDIATQGYALARHDQTEDGRHWAAVLLHDIGYCQMRLDHADEAEKNFQQAYATLRELALADSTYNHMNSWARVAYNILDAYTSTGHYKEATHWIASAEEAITGMTALQDCPKRVAEEYLGSLNTHKAIIYIKTGHKKEADEAYRQFLQSGYAETSFGLIDNSEYLMEAEQWFERSKLTPRLDSLTQAWDMPLSMYYLCAYLAPNFTAYLKSGQHNEALKIAQYMVESLDSINEYEQKHNAEELAIVYETQEKEMKIAEQQSLLDYQRMVAISVALLLMALFLAVFMFFRHRAAMKLEEKNRELEQKNKLLTVANARAEESSRMKSDFIRQISHEIRTPLNILNGFTQVVTAPDIQLNNAEKQDISQRITENTERITGLVNKMLALSDSNSQTVIERTDEVSALLIASMAVDKSKISTIQQATFQLLPDETAETTMLHTNQEQAVLALMQLLDNARKFTKQGSVTLSVVTKSPHTVSFVIEDTGIGVPVYEAERIFGEFVQLDEYYDGTGIGLTVARSITRRLGGDITLDTTYKNGARFVMTLPTGEN